MARTKRSGNVARFVWFVLFCFYYIVFLPFSNRVIAFQQSCYCIYNKCVLRFLLRNACKCYYQWCEIFHFAFNYFHSFFAETFHRSFRHAQVLRYVGCLGMFHLTHYESHAPLFAHICERLFEPLFKFAHAEQVVGAHFYVDVGCGV